MFLDLLDAAEFAARGVACFVARHAAADVFLSK